MPSVLIVDDDVELSELLREYLQQEGFDTDAVHDGESGVARALEGAYDIVVLDVMMPRLDGVEALRRIRLASRVPVLMLTAKGDDVDRIVGLELGADDYVPKPCTPRELAARLRAILRRVRPGDAGAADEPLAAGPLSLWPGRRRAQWRGAALALTSTEFSLLEVLARHAGRVVGKSELSEQALGRPLARFDRSIDVHVSSLRQKLGQRDDGRSWIETVRGRGYQFLLD
ncbi:MAG TPA: response regulator transcription factor [Burkholderiaceae bacterium]|jgi:DNA-binding response OmpR family regulator|nr:response regulator transcription factor [Burkholderiaceae bacterium]